MGSVRTHLVDVNGLELDAVEETSSGALVTNTNLAALLGVRRDYGMLSRAIVAGALGQLRNKATTPATACSAPAALLLRHQPALQ
jgi:xanthine dehydrogenase YagS FAD-binding subunit